MKKYITLPLLSVLALTLGTGTATARDDEALYALGGFIGGVITTKVLDRHNHRQQPAVYSQRNCAPAPRHYSHGHNKHSCDHGCSQYRAPRGHYKTVQVRKWVPGHREVYYNRCGDRVRRWEPGYYTYVTKRVWVGYGNNHHRNHNEYAYR